MFKCYIVTLQPQREFERLTLSLLVYFISSGIFLYKSCRDVGGGRDTAIRQRVDK